MNTHDIIAEIHRIREKQAAECDFDPKRIGARMRARQKERAARGARYVSFVGGTGILREDPPTA
jgi:sensor histidine kinase regulating citrate/malate metabolism